MTNEVSWSMQSLAGGGCSTQMYVIIQWRYQTHNVPQCWDFWQKHTWEHLQQHTCLQPWLHIGTILCKTNNDFYDIQYSVAHEVSPSSHIRRVPGNNTVIRNKDNSQSIKTCARQLSQRAAVHTTTPSRPPRRRHAAAELTNQSGQTATATFTLPGYLTSNSRPALLQNWWATSSSSGVRYALSCIMPHTFWLTGFRYMNWSAATDRANPTQPMTMTGLNHYTNIVLCNMCLAALRRVWYWKHCARKWIVDK